ncbi:hypothetical protein [Streptosporangium saharense]|uniref:Uncharacterized protein n=1 Tax=Streptosporangium saharense TaxID=1706840 RepID=A0A7W7VK47_9ACTN|nr:hypothetical protein [Streptosporangium saharense]MBB4912974.1 hypothetical protein [Streptosporangium saharense]
MTGRHRDGQPYASVYQRVWDGPARAEAERLDQTWADWTVLYSLGKRSFYAVASWDGPQVVVVEDATSEGLEERMQEAEMVRMLQTTPPRGEEKRLSAEPSDRDTPGTRDRGPARRRRSSPGGRAA